MVIDAGKIAFQGEPGAYSHQACAEVFPKAEAIACRTFEGAIEAVHEGRADLAMLPVENSTYGRVADIHHLLPESGLHIIGEHFVRVHINLLGVPGARIEQVQSAMSHTVLLGQCRTFLKENKLQAITGADTAGSAQIIAERAGSSFFFIASDGSVDGGRKRCAPSFALLGFLNVARRLAFQGRRLIACPRHRSRLTR